MFAFWRRMCYDVVNQMMKTELLRFGAVTNQKNDSQEGNICHMVK
jgi:hypothetical protein